MHQVALTLRRRSDHGLAEMLARAESSPLSYAPVGMSMVDHPPPPYRKRRWQTVLESDAFEAAVNALRAWQVHRGAGLSVAADGPLRVGTCVAMCAPLPIGFVDATCRIVEVIDEPGRFGFAYGTLAVHPESGEEAFIVEKGDSVCFCVEVASRPRHPLARLAPPIANRLQAAASQRYLQAMRRATTSAF